MDETTWKNALFWNLRQFFWCVIFFAFYFYSRDLISSLQNEWNMLLLRIKVSDVTIIVVKNILTSF